MLFNNAPIFLAIKYRLTQNWFSLMDVGKVLWGVFLQTLIGATANLKGGRRELVCLRWGPLLMGAPGMCASVYEGSAVCHSTDTVCTLCHPGLKTQCSPCSLPLFVSLLPSLPFYSSCYCSLSASAAKFGIANCACVQLCTGRLTTWLSLLLCRTVVCVLECRASWQLCRWDINTHMHTSEFRKLFRPF